MIEDVLSTRKKEEVHESLTFYDVNAIRNMFGVGRNTALKIIRVAGGVKIGRKRMIARPALEHYIDEHGGISWPSQ